MKPLTHITRIIVGVLFVFSGFVKLVDPIGSQYKFQEYFSEAVLNMEFLIPYALPLAILLIVAEVVLGIALLVGWKSKFTIWSLLILIVVFLFLTWYSAYFNKVTDCGCFGDALKLTPWQSFYKDVILTALIVFLIFRIKDIHPIYKEKTAALITYASLFLSLFITYYVLTHLPIVDFRAYAIGKNIPEGMKYKDDGEIPPIHDFILEDSQQDLAPEILKEEKVVLIISYNIKKSNKEGFVAIKDFSEKALQLGYTVYGVSASFTDNIQEIQQKYKLPFEFLFCDETTLKTMIRANPGIMILKSGTVAQKKNWVDLEEIEL